MSSGVQLAMKQDAEMIGAEAREIVAVRVAAIDPEAAWAQLVARDKAARFIYAVETTGVFCRVGCGSRPPRRENVRFFDSADSAQKAGFRPCLRCRPGAAAIASSSSLDRSSAAH